MSTYLSHPVRRIREDPIEGETVSLVLGFDDVETTADDVAEAVANCGGEVVDELPFEALRVVVAHERVDALCEIDGLSKVETTNTISLTGDE